MADVREMLARLNQQTIRYDVGRGGIAELSNQDIAAALAFVEPGLGRELLEACWWPDGASLRRHHLRNAVLQLVQPELRRQWRMMEEARTDAGIAVACMGWSGSATAEQLREVERTKVRLEQVTAQCWPRATMESLPVLAQAVIREMAQRSLCPACAGRGHLTEGELVVSCKACSSSGIVPASNVERARRMGRDEASYRRNWKAPFEWMLQRFRDAEAVAAQQLAKALARDAA